ncbi:hypothetical protein MAQ5080_02499 [Marinomonas aquimarina]|uniref:Uncharacterized protein n=1 Tax=Marinomonas aquimarina TaxID=295068 RepID=A0A1A8TL82_9GAMM|nr:hypothetical protein MAQ5080_02499 [Marinomonas aquimarina]
MKALRMPSVIALTFAGSVIAALTSTNAERSAWRPQDAMKQSKRKSTTNECLDGELPCQ